MTELNNKHPEEPQEDELEYTHKVTLTMYSNGNDPNEMWLTMEWEPDLNGKEIEALGYIPPSFDFAQDYILPALEKAESDEWEKEKLTAMPSPSNRRN